MRNYQIGTIVFNNWTIKRRIGEGSFGKVFEIERDDFGETYKAALKVITVPQNEAELQGVLDQGLGPKEAEAYFYGMVEEIVREFAIMAKLKGTGNVVNYEDHIVIKHDNGIGWDILIRMELLNPLLPYAYEHPFARKDIIRLGVDICKSLELCQKYNIIHRDIKPENIFVSDNGDFKLGDFGIARTIENTMSGLSKKGTYNYMAPEVYRGSDYGFNVDLYSLGIVLYRLLNKNRIPFMPPAPEAITFKNQEMALAKRMGGEAIPQPFYASGRLGEIVLKACAFDPKDRYSSPSQMRSELEAILYDEKDASLIYPDGDELLITKNRYVTEDKATLSDENLASDKTESIFGGHANDQFDQSKTESVFSSKSETIDSFDSSKTESVYKHVQFNQSRVEKTDEKPKKKKLLPIVIVALIVIGGITGFLIYNGNIKEKEKEYNALISQANSVVETNPKQAAELYLKAQSYDYNSSEPFISYAYALYKNDEYDQCIDYIENALGLGKQYDVQDQSRLSEILAASYFEKGDYAAAASFFRLSNAGGDITVSSMRDYAVSLGRLGDVSAADEIMKKMSAAGASGDMQDYVQAEVDFALKNYVDAESGFLKVLDNTQDTTLQRRSLRSVAELYRDCTNLSKTGKSPIDKPAIKECEVLAQGIATYGLDYDASLWEMLAMSYFEAYKADKSLGSSYLKKSADAFVRVLDLGIQKDYLYSNLYTIYYDLKDYDSAAKALDDYENFSPDSYVPHALRSMMYITIENAKPQTNRNYERAVLEYEVAEKLIKKSDDTTYYQQLKSLINQLKNKGWI